MSKKFLALSDQIHCAARKVLRKIVHIVAIGKKQCVSPGSVSRDNIALHLL